MKKVIAIELLLVLLLAGVMTLLLYQKEPRKDVTAEEVHTTFASVIGDAAISEGGNLRIRRDYNLNAADYDLIVYYTSDDSMEVTEFLMVRASESERVTIKAAMEKRISSQIEAFTGYGEKQVAQLEKAIVVEYGDYIILLIGDDATTWHTALKALLEV